MSSTLPGHRRNPLDLSIALLAILGGWLLMHMYRGLYQDAVLYTMQALNHAAPSVYSNDLYLRFGSQDQYTVFSRLQATLIEHLGVEQAARLLTISGQLMLLLGAWGLARRLLPAGFAAAALAVFATMPAIYGATATFHVMEDFATPRIFSEVLVLAGLISWLHARRVLSIALVAVAFVIHPLMAAAGAMVLFWLGWGLSRPRLAAIAVATGAAALIILGLVLEGPPWRFDSAWLSVVQRTSMLFVEQWTATDWGTSLVPVVTVIAAAVLAPPDLRRFLVATLLCVATGLALTWLGGDRLHLTWVVQAQPWRALWLCTAVSLLVIPWLGAQLWGQGVLGRATALMLVAAYLLLGQSFVLPVLALTIGALISHQFTPRIEVRIQRLVFIGAVFVLALAFVVSLASLHLVVAHHSFSGESGSLPLWVIELRKATEYCLFAPVLCVLLIELARRAGSIPWRATLTVAAVLYGVVFIPSAWAQWTRVQYTSASDEALFAPWRAHVPPGADVLYATDTPLFVWLVLQRPSYLTLQQEASAIFSRAAAMEVMRREEELRGYPEAVRLKISLDDTSDVARGTLQDLCNKARADVAFVVSAVDLQAATVANIPENPPSRYSNLKLYQCPN